jgi:hypothetical protein
MVRNPMKNEDTQNFSPSYEELLNELSGINSRLTLENIALKITISKMQSSIENSDEDFKTPHNK